MSCVTGVCGTGGWGGPLPGDPDNNVFLSANTVFGGIKVSWSYPTTNANAVAFTILYRGVNANFAEAIELHRVGSNVYRDALEPDTEKEYFYWIRIMSVNGTLADTIGPVSAIARPMSVWNLESLTGMIDAGVLATSLRGEIDRIPMLNTNILQEIEDRLASNTALANILDLVQNVSNETKILIEEEITQRQDADGAFVNSMNLMFAQYEGAAAAILEEKTIRVTKDEAFAQNLLSMGASMNGFSAALTEEQNVRATGDSALVQSILTLNATIGTTQASIITEQTARVNADGAQASLITDLYTKTDENKAAIQLEQTTRTTQDSALAQSITTLTATTNSNTATIQQEISTRTTQDTALAQSINTMNAQLSSAITAAVQVETNSRVTQDSALANQITTTQATLNGNIASVQTVMQSQINEVTGELNSIWTAKVDVNGMVGGFGIYGTPTQVEAGFDVDLFWIGRTNSDRVKPFIVIGGVVFMDIAVIRDADIGTLKVAGNAITGLSAATGGSNNVPSGGGVNLVSTGLIMPSGSAGVLIDVTVALNSASNSTQIMTVYKDGSPLGSSGISLMGGFAGTGTFKVLDANPTVGYATYSFGVSNPNSGPGSNVAAGVTTSSIVVSGAKR